MLTPDHCPVQKKYKNGDIVNANIFFNIILYIFELEKARFFENENRRYTVKIRKWCLAPKTDFY